MANHYVRQGATGNADGTDWTNAWTDLPATLTRGDTYYIADGTYLAYYFNDAESGTDYIHIKKATISDHGTEVGWDASGTYGDGVALFQQSGAVTGWNFVTGYWDIDGQVGSGKGGHGFKVEITNPHDGDQVVYVALGGVSHINIAYVDIDGNDEGELSVEKPRIDGIQLFSSGAAVTDINISYCYIHDCTRTHILTTNTTDVTVDHCYFAKRLGGWIEGTENYIHGEAISVNTAGVDANWIIRYCIFEDIAGTGCIVIKDSTQEDCWMYGNVVFHTDVKYTFSNGVFCNTSGDTNNYMYVYNNTFVDLNTSSDIEWDSGSNNVAYNNLWYNSGTPGFTNVTHDYNAADVDLSEANDQLIEADPFTNYAGDVFTLSAATNDGTDLGQDIIEI